MTLRSHDRREDSSVNLTGRSSSETLVESRFPDDKQPARTGQGGGKAASVCKASEDSPSEQGQGSSERLKEAERGFKCKDVTQVYVPMGMVRESVAEAEFRKKLLKWRRRIGHGALRTVVNSGETQEGEYQRGQRMEQILPPHSLERSSYS